MHINTHSYKNSATVYAADYACGLSWSQEYTSGQYILYITELSKDLSEA